MFCPKCGVQLVSDASPFCTQCGAPVKASAQAPVKVAGVAQVSVPAVVPGTRKSGTKLWLWAALVGLVLLGSAALYFRSGSEVKGIWATGSDVNIVRDGVLKAYNTTTVGKAFEGTFQNAKWTSFETPKKEVVVEFNGTITPKALETAGFLGFAIQEAARPSYPGRESCISSLGLKVNLDQEAQTSKQMATAFQEERKRFMEKATAALGPVSGDPFGDPWDELGKSIRSLQSRSTNSPTTSTTLEALEQERNSISKSQKEQWKPVEARQAENEAKIKSCQETVPIPVKFQFALSADKKTFRIQYIDDKAFFRAAQNDVLAFVYQ
jgi:hypothetical protein